MKQANDDIVVEGAAPVAQVITYLEQLVDALKSGAVHVRHGDYELVLGPREVIDLSVIAKVRDKRHRLALELTWRRKSHRPDEELELRFAAGPSGGARAEVVTSEVVDEVVDAEVGEVAGVDAGDVAGVDAGDVASED